MWSRIDPFDGYLPKGREGHVMWEIGSSKLIVFGGRAYSYNDDMLEFSLDTSQWKVITPKSKPFSRYAARIAFDTIANEVYMFGGLSYSGESNELWVFNNINYEWRKIPQTSTNWPEKRYAHCFSSYVYNGVSFLLLYGGKNEKILSDLWSFDTSLKTWTLINQTGPLYNPPPTYDMSCMTTDRYLYVLNGKVQDGSITTISEKIVRAYIPFNTSSTSWKVSHPVVPNYTPRSNTQAVMFSNYIIWFGGTGTSDDFNDFYSLSLVNNAVTRVNMDFLSPSSLMGHTMTSLGTSIYMFGGLTEEGVPSNTLYKFSIEYLNWTIIDTTTQPDPRAYHAQVTLGDRIWVFGGKESASKIFSDMWHYSFNSDTWESTEVSSTYSPSPRYHHAMVQNGTHIFLFGGRTQTSSLSDLWIFDTELRVWTKVNVNVQISYTIGCTAKLYTEKDTRSYQTILLIGCQDFSELPSSEFYKFEFFDKDTNTVNFTVAGSFPAGIEPRTGVIAIKISNYSAIIFGGRQDNHLFNDVLFLDAASGNMKVVDSPLLNPGIIPPARAYHSYTYVGGSLFIFGGMGAPKDTNYLMSSIRLGDLWKYNLKVCHGENEADCNMCGSGTYEAYGICLFCPPGTYNDQFGAGSCTPCPRGFYNENNGANHAQYCLPCSQSYANKTGSSSCTPCPSGATCPLGSTQPIYNFTVNTEKNSIQPNEYISKESENTIAVGSVGAALAGVTFTILFIVFIGWKVFNFPKTEWVQRLDMFYTERHNRIMGTMIKRRTAPGACYSFIVLVAFLAYLVATIVPY